MREFCAMLLAALALAGFACEKRPERGGAGNGENGPPVSILPLPVRIVLEAESASSDIAPFEVESNAEASGGKCVLLAEKWATEAELHPTFKTREGGKPVSMKTASDNPLGRALVPNGTVELPFEVKKAGRYAVWVRANFHCSCGNSFFLSVDSPLPVDTDGDSKYDENVPYTLGGSTYKRWKWVTLRRKTFQLAEGPHVVRIFNREDGIRIDQVLFAEIPKGPLPPYEPVGMEKSQP